MRNAILNVNPRSRSTGAAARQAGLTLLEVQISLLLLMVGVLAVVAMAPVGSRNIDLARKSTLAMSYARHLMESTRALAYDHQGTVSRRTLVGLLPSVPDGFEYQVLVDIPPENVELHRIEVTVFWLDQDARGAPFPRSYRLVGYSAKIS